MHSMTMEPGSDAVGNFAGEYARMNDGELMNVARDYDSLVGPAQEALRAEFERRQLEPPVVGDDGPEVVGSERLVTVRRYRDLTDAMVGRAALESAGVFCFLRDENVVRLDWAYSNLVGGLRLEVRPEDVVAAEELLGQPIPESIDYGTQAQFTQPHCPRCGSIDITFLGADRSLALVTGLPLPLGAEAWQCDTCGCKWSDDGEDAG